MSGILAVWNRNGQPVHEKVVRAMLAAAPSRAVDGQDVWFGVGVAMAHQHFWVTPEEQDERQPLLDASGQRVIAADLRLDNRRELLAELGLDAFHGQGLSDAAVVLEAYARWGTACVEHLLGDFSLTIWDAIEQHLFLARDALGTRGLCYYVDREHCLVGSEVRQLLEHPAVSPRINEGKIADFLVGLWGDQEETFYQGIAYCPPAHCLLVSATSVKKWRYWDVDPGARIRYRNDAEYAEHFLALLTEAVRCRLRCMGPVAISMSGGLDSTSLAAIATDVLSESGLAQDRLKSFTSVFNELADCDERRYVELVVDRLQLDASYIRCDDRWTLRDLDRWPSNRGFVLSDPYALLPRAIMEQAQRAGCRVLMGGYYGDVLFTGGVYWAAGLLRELRFIRLACDVLRHWTDIRWRRDLVDHGLAPLVPAALRRALRHWRPRADTLLCSGLHPSFVARTNLVARAAADANWRKASVPELGQRWRSLSLNVFAQAAAPAQSECHDYGLDLAMPYWDRRLVEFVMAVPAHQLGRPWRDRWMVRRAMTGFLPETVRERRGRTVFLSLMEKGLLGEERETVERLMEDPLIVQAEYIRPDWLRQRLGCGRAWVSTSEAYFLWKCISLELWLSYASTGIDIGSQV